MRIRTNLSSEENNETYLTERQWAQKGYVKNDGETGEIMYTNRFCQHSYAYFTEKQMHLATPEELAAYWKPERQRRSEQRRKAKERDRLEQERIERREAEARQRSLEQRKRYVADLERAVLVISKVAVQLAQQIDLEPETEAPEIVVDCETTGLDSQIDEILQLSIIDGNGNTLYNSYFKPLRVSSWASAAKINGITPQMVENAPCIYEELPKINAILRHARTIIGYNPDFDLAFLEAAGAVLPEDVEIVDVMTEFAPIYGEWSEYHGDYKWQKLSTCAAHYGYDWGKDSAHDSLADCRATLFCFHKLQEPEQT